jgi:LPXTG-motif cell wall-anchored protein
MKKRFRTHLLIIIFLLVCPHAISFAETKSTEVTANVSPVYSFSIPADTAIPYKQAETHLGQFRVNDLLLYDGETLTLEVTAGALRRGSSGSSIPYTLNFVPPQSITEADIGRGFDAGMSVAPADFLAARSGTYKGTITFSIRSSVSNGIVWTGSTNISLKVPGGYPPFEPPVWPEDNPEVTVLINGETYGRVFHERTQLRNGAVIETAPNDTVTLTLDPNKGYGVKQVLLNGKNVTDKVWPNGWLIITKINSDCVVEISFARSASVPKTGSGTMLPLAAGCVLFALMLLILIKKRRKPDDAETDDLC